ncbi:glycerol-3-phosphate dehydrogenase/oxidase [Microbacterium esteraromaticum]|uniref:glycerol-3-phosphate dehydrogenase/oxidase n=1 Tax=Microbacterium esteraromaticum TaxID=57043 RepID=UPI001A8E8B33|nr:glycerol-3-phosphate dehydrogenase/oxidase [Microbacterium esteraromaticum]MBN8423279.1 glycerol-3-phosphate dehydrogenase/oxidase [Microbacterium esteraromaticum]
MTSAAAHTAELNAARRRRELTEVAETTVDVVVVGGGITGAGVALDAASRGLSVALIEAHDLAFGTSRFSSKLVHGGLRYLATGDLATAKESALERHLLMTHIAPHLIRPLGQLLPFSTDITARQRAAGAFGMGIGDLLRMRARTPRSVLPRPRLVSAHSARRLVPALEDHGLRGGMLSFDGQLVDDARLVTTVARTAAAHGARVLTRVRALQLRRDGITAEDALTAERFEIRARSVINATGVWAGTLDDTLTVRPSRGTHIVLDAADLGGPTAALTIPHEGSISRYVFALPQQHGRVIVGLTDEDAPGPIPLVAEPAEHEIDFLLRTLNRVLATPIGRDSVRGAFSGLRPLIDSGSGATADVSRRHLVTDTPSGAIAVLGGKLTTYRRMAQDAVDHAVRTRLGGEIRPSCTSTLCLVDGPPAASDRPFGDALDVSVEDVVFAVRAEGALSADDVLDRRTRIGLVDDDRRRCLPEVERIVSETLAELDA